MDDQIRVRRIEARDFEAVTTLLTELGRPALQPATRDQVRQVFLEHVADPDAATLIAERNARAVGVITLHFRPRLNWATAEAWVPDLIVTETERGSGVAVALFRSAVEQARMRGCHRLVLESGYTRQRAHRFYEREGMTDAGKYFVLELGQHQA